MHLPGSPGHSSAAGSIPFAQKGLSVLCLALASAAALPTAHAATSAPVARSEAAAHPTTAFWHDVKGATAATSAKGAQRAATPKRFRATSLDKLSMAAAVAGAPMEFTQAARQNPVVISLPTPEGGFQRFAVVESPIMEAGLAAKHPEIKTYSARGIDDPSASLRMDITPLGFHASVRSQKGQWYLEPVYHLDDSVYQSFYRRDVPKARTSFLEAGMTDAQVSVARGLYHAADAVQVTGSGFAPGTQVAITVTNPEKDFVPRQIMYATAGKTGIVNATLVADPYRTLGTYNVTLTDGRASATTLYQVVSDAVTPSAATGNQLRTYRLALVTDPAYATYFGGSANVTAAKVVLINRVSQVYETETSIRLVLINGTDALNLDTAAQATGANGPCGGSACFTAAQIASCGSGTLTRNRIVVGLLAGAGNFDIGHIGLGVNGGGIASLGVVGGNNKAQGCTGIPTPVGDFFAVDYVAHEMGHEFAGNHTFNGTVSNCSTGNRNAGTSVEPGSGSSVMAYAGICGTDNLQPHSDAYWSQRSFDEITTYTSAAETNINEVQMGVLTNFVTANAQSFQLQYGGNLSAPITGGTNYTTAGVKAAIEAIAGWPAGGTVTVSTLGDTAFTVTFGGTLAGVNAGALTLVNCTGGCTGYVGEIAKGGQTTKGGTVTATGNSAPVVTTAAGYTIPVQTPFALTGSAVDSEGDTITYMWEQNDRGATGTSAGTGLITQPKLNGPLFRQFGIAAQVTAAGTILYNSPGENLVTTNPTRVFPDIAQIIVNNTNAETGSCPLAVPTAPSASEIDCFSEYLPTPVYVGTAGVNATPASLNFRLTARDGRGGVGNAATVLTLAPAAGPFLVTSPNTAVSMDSLSTQTVTWSVANTDVAPVGAANVKISLSVDGGFTYPYVLAASTPNTGSKSVTIPNVGTTAGRVKVEAVGNIFFDISNADFTVRLLGDLDGDNAVGCTDLSIVRASFGKRVGDPGFDPRADVNNDGVVDVLDLSFVAKRVTAGTRCPG